VVQRLQVQVNEPHHGCCHQECSSGPMPGSPELEAQRGWRDS
jgi:hypothetical protein